MENQDKHMFELDDEDAYAGTEVDVWQAMRFLNELKAVALNELSAEDQTCAICRQPYGDLDKEATGCTPVQLPCSHVLGKECLAMWITPLGDWKDNNNQWEEENNWFDDPVIRFSGSADCPLCRREFFKKPRNWESAKGLEARLMLWDRAYEKLGCLRSEKEEQSRDDLIQYIEFYRKSKGNTIEKTEAEIEQRWSELQAYYEIASCTLFYFAMYQKKNQVLTPTQARLQRNLEHISIYGLNVTLDDPLFEDFKNRYGDYENFELGMEQRNREENDTGGNNRDDNDRDNNSREENREDIQ